MFKFNEPEEILDENGNFLFYKIYKDTDPVLRTICTSVEHPYTDEIKDMVKKMVTHLINSQNRELAQPLKVAAGVGLAAPQIGVSGRFYAVYFVKDGITTKYGLINPKITFLTDEKCSREFGEGCLSVPYHHEGYVRRAYKIRVEGFDVLSDKDISFEEVGFGAVCEQHEYDHLDGILYYDRINQSDPFNATDLIILKQNPSK